MQLPILDLQYVKADLSYDCHFLHMVRHPKKLIQIDSVVWSSLTVQFFSFGPKILSANETASFFYIRYLQNGLIFWLYFVHRELASWSKPTE